MIKLSKSASLIRKKNESPAPVTRTPDPVTVTPEPKPDPAPVIRPMRVTTGRPNPVICERVNKCAWYQAPGILEDDYGAICVLATLHYEVNHRRKSRVTDHIVSMSECPLPRLEAEYPAWKDRPNVPVDHSRIPPMPLIKGPYVPVKFWKGVKIPWR